MYMPAIMAFLHHLAAFALVGTILVEVALFKPPLTVVQARRVQIADSLYGISAGILLVVGLLRVFFFEKGAGYYFKDTFFLTKLAGFIVVGLLSIYPTVLFLSWSKALKQGVAPDISAAQAQRARLCLMWELAGIAVILLCAAFMARGFGYFGASG